ncbi:MAG TPA: hypothetical protein VN767_19250 [Streptosporangiaceae bacterium]|nr:hypothetical protein [Streptosporangiaceae bacterium]
MTGPQAGELRWIEDELARVDRARTWLVNRRQTLLTELASYSAAIVVPGPEIARPELSGRTVARILLVVGAMLVVIAAAVFTVASWSSIGAFGRCSVLLAVTAIVLATPRLLTGRDLVATAEAIAGVGLALTLADGYLAEHLLNVPGRSLMAAGGYAVIAGAWVGYGWTTRLRVPVVAGIGMAQLPALYVTVDLASRSPAGPLAFVLVLTAGADLLLARALTRRALRAQALASWILAAAAWTIGVGLAAQQALTAPGHWPWQAPTFIAAAVVGIALGPKNEAASPIPILSGVLLSIGLALPIATAGGLGVVAFAVAGAAVLAGSLWWRPRPSRPAGFVGAGASAVLAMAGLLVLPSAVVALGWSARRGLPGWPVVIVLGLAGLACLAGLARGGPVVANRNWVRALAVVLGALAVASVPLAVGAAGWARLGIVDLAVAALIGLAAAQGGSAADSQERRGWAQPGVVVTAALGGIVLAASAAAAPVIAWAGAVHARLVTATTIVELAVLGVVFVTAAIFASNTRAAAISTGAALAAVGGLAFAASAAAGFPAAQTSFAALGVAVLAIAGSTWVSKTRPVEGLVLDLGAGVLVAAAAIVAAEQSDSFAAVAALGAVLASSAAWLRGGARRTVALASAGCAALAALALTAQWRPLTQAWFGNYRPWNGHPLMGTAHAGLPFATWVLALSLAAIVSGVGAWQGERRGSLDALAIALPIVIVSGALSVGPPYAAVLACLLALAVGLTTRAAIDGSLAPVSAAVVATVVTLAWALASPVATIVTLTCLASCYLILASRSQARIATAALGVFATASLVSATMLAVGQPAWLAGISAIVTAAAAHAIAARLASRLPLTAMAVEFAAWTTTVIGIALCLGHPATTSLAFALAGLECLAVALSQRQRRRPLLWIGLVALEIAWYLLLAILGITIPEAYTIPAAAIALAFTWRAAARNSWAASPGLALLLLPSLIIAGQTQGWIRPTALGFAAAGVTLAGARLRQRAPLLIGATVAALDAGDRLAPDVRRLTELLPGWVPFAIIGAVLLWSGATYEARLRNLARLRRTLAGLH